MVPRSVVSAILFSPRGGSAHMARALASGLRETGWSVTLVAGSHGGTGTEGTDADAQAFYGDVQAVDFAPALASGAPLRYEGPPGTAPLHPSFEDREGAPDLVFARIDDLGYERQVRAWSRELVRAGAPDTDVLHLHHLTPLNEAARRVAPGVPIVGHLHGTELLMLEQIAAGPPEGWVYAERWAERMRGWARACTRIMVAPAGVDRAVSLLGISRERIVTLPGGVDVQQFAPRPVDRSLTWQRALVDSPRGWLPGHPPGSVRYTRAQAGSLADAVVLAYVGRFTAVKRLDLLIAAFARVRSRVSRPVALVLIGGHPDEWEGEHPALLAERFGVDDVFLVGWYGQDELPGLLGGADVIVMASDHEQFGQALIEGMACGLPAVATRSLGPAAIVEDGETGWLVPAGDEAALAEALREAVDDGEERVRRGSRARASVRRQFAWPAVTARLEAVLAEVAEERLLGAPASHSG